MQIISNYIPKNIVCPYFLTEDKIETMQRYRIYVDRYNKTVKERNKKISDYNKTVATFVASHNLMSQAKKVRSDFKKQQTHGITHKFLSTEDYNYLVEKTNKDRPLIPKQKFQRIRQAQEATFEIILWLYSKQLQRLRKHLQQLATNVAVSFPKVSVTSLQVCEFQKEGVRRNLNCKETILNHVHRLRATGVFVDYQFHGRKKPVEYFINPAIFVFRDKRETPTEKQQVSYFLKEKFPNYSVDTRTITKKRIKKIGNVDNHSQKAEVASFADGKNRNSYKITKKDDVLKTSNLYAGKLAVRENLSENKLSEYLRSQILYRSEFLQGLTEQQYVNYSYSACQMQRRLEAEATKGVLSREEFRELLLQQFLKIAAPIWKGMNVYYGSWHKAYEQIDDEYLRNPNGSIPRKETLLYQFGLLVYRISRAKRFFKKKKNYCIHYPCIYFDPTRKQQKEGGFAYTLEWLKKYQKYQDDRTIRQQQRATKAGNRRRQMTAEEKVRSKIKLYINGKLSLPQVFAYIEHNKGIPNYFSAEVPRILNTLTHKEFDLYE